MIQGLEMTVVPFADQRELGEGKGDGLIWQPGACLGPPMRKRVGVQFAGQREMEPEILQHIGIAPADQVVFLPVGQARRTATREFLSTGRRAETIKRRHTSRGNIMQRFSVTDRTQCQKAAQTLDPQAIRRRSRQHSGQGTGSPFQSLQRLSVSKAEWRFDRTMKPVFARCHSDVIKPCNEELPDGASVTQIPSKPFGPEICQPVLIGDGV